MAKKLLLGAALLVSLCYSASSQCTTSTLKPGYHDETTSGNSVKVGSDIRYFGVYIPDGHTSGQPYKVIFDFHGAHGTPTGQYQNSQYYLNKLGKEYLVIYPLGVDNIWQGSPCSTANDFAFVEALIPCVKQQYNIDSARIFASGKSQGAGFVDQLACNPSLGNNFAAFAMASAALYQHAKQSDCTNIVKPRKILEAHGNIDEVIPYTGGDHPLHCPDVVTGHLPDIDDWQWWWASSDNYTTRQHSTLKNPYDLVSYTGNPNGAIVQHYYVYNNGHCWPQKAGPPWNTDYTTWMKQQSSNSSDTPLNCKSTALDFTNVVVNFFEAAVSANTKRSEL